MDEKCSVVDVLKAYGKITLLVYFCRDLSYWDFGGAPHASGRRSAGDRIESSEKGSLL